MTNLRITPDPKTLSQWKADGFVSERMAEKMAKAKMRYCFNCGEQLGKCADYDPLDTCGAKECDRAARDAARQERDEAHEQLDRDMGWGSY